ncbi:hypothetical protein OHT52_06330 [Streptomyces sp. NBC_00247]|uniref:hypothetical protein n=1 Tax=Streptomyces sp. NBC_00247 TaxID=2975689 RepID=UPI002E28444A|nr:hypothetical protein [Streptomyces sp. NBC_00247]
MRQTTMQRWAARHPKRALALWSSMFVNLFVGGILFTIAGDALSCPLDGGTAMHCDDPSKAGDPVLSVLARIGLIMILLGVTSVIGAIAWYVVLLKREVDTGRR